MIPLAQAVGVLKAFNFITRRGYTPIRDEPESLVPFERWYRCVRDAIEEFIREPTGAEKFGSERLSLFLIFMKYVRYVVFWYLLLLFMIVAMVFLLPQLVGSNPYDFFSNHPEGYKSLRALGDTLGAISPVLQVTAGVAGHIIINPTEVGAGRTVNS